MLTSPVSVPARVQSSPEVQAGPGDKTVWTEGDKAGFGTARTWRSNVWFTLQQGRTSEVFYPDLSTPSVRNLELIVTDGTSFADRESTDMRHRTIRPDVRSLGFTQVNTAKSGKYRITKRIVTDPRRDALVIRVRLRSLDGGRYRLFALHDPALANGGMDDTGRTVGNALVASDGNVATALVSKPAFGGTSNGFLGENDGWTDLKDDYRLDQHSQQAGPGNVVQTGRIPGVTGKRGHRSATLTLGFGKTGPQARQTANHSKATGFQVTKRRYDRGWHHYLESLKRVPASARGMRRQYLASALVLAAAEDKQNPGAFVASPSAPWAWGDEDPDLSSPSDAYHLVWSRDAYEFGTALWAMGDKAAARRIVDWLFTVQQKADGSFPQNSTVTGTPAWTELQLDEVALPIVLAHLVGRDGPATYRHVKEAANFLANFTDDETGLAAPFSPQERWENQSGYSPNSIAAQISGLVCAAAPGAEERRRRVRGQVARARGRVEVEGQALDGHPERPAERPAVLPCASPRTASRMWARRTESVTAGPPSSTSDASSTRASSTSSATASFGPATRSCGRRSRWSTGS